MSSSVKGTGANKGFAQPTVGGGGDDVVAAMILAVVMMLTTMVMMMMVVVFWWQWLWYDGSNDYGGDLNATDCA